MKNQLIAIFFVTLVYTLNTVDCLQFSIYDHKCRNVTDSRRKITILTGTTIEKCVEGCWRRPRCKSAIYKRLYPLCELYGVDVSTLEPERMGTSCAVIKRDDVKMDGKEVSKMHVKTPLLTARYASKHRKWK